MIRQYGLSDMPPDYDPAFGRSFPTFVKRDDEKWEEYRRLEWEKQESREIWYDAHAKK